MIYNCTLCSEWLKYEVHVRRNYELCSEFHDKLFYVRYEADFVSECDSNLMVDIVFA